MNKGNKFVRFLKRYGYYCAAGVLTVAIALTLALTLNVNRNTDVPENEIPISTTPITFGLPLGDYKILKSFSDSELQYNATMGQWEAHKAIDLSSETGTVFAVLDGTVTDITTSFENGTSVTIEHADGYKTVYSSLAETLKVAKGDKVLKGQELGSISSTANNEASYGNHLHLEMYKDGTKVDPANYIQFENK